MGGQRQSSPEPTCQFGLPFIFSGGPGARSDLGGGPVFSLVNLEFGCVIYFLPTPFLFL